MQACLAAAVLRMQEPPSRKRSQLCYNRKGLVRMRTQVLLQEGATVQQNMMDVSHVVGKITQAGIRVSQPFEVHRRTCTPVMRAIGRAIGNCEVDAVLCGTGLSECILRDTSKSLLRMKTRK